MFSCFRTHKFYLLVIIQNARHSIPGLTGAEYRLKEKLFLRKVEIKDLEDTEGMLECLICYSALCLDFVLY